MNQEVSTRYGLEDRTLLFAKKVRFFVHKLPKSIGNIEDGKQVVRSSGSVGANFIEAVESFSDKDYLYRLKICRKEAKETNYWLKLIKPDSENLNDQKALIQESFELMNIFGSLVRKKEL